MQVTRYQCDRCSRIMEDDGVVLKGALTRVSGKTIVNDGTSWCKECLIYILDPSREPTYERGGPGDR